MSSADDRSAWGSAPWTPTTSPETQTTVGWQKHVAYIPESTNSLQTLTAWVPATSDRSPPDDASLPRRPGRWIIFIHGGAWRDPAVTAAAFDRAAAALLLRNQDSTSTSKGSRIAGLASLNYRLSPYPGRPSDDPAYKALVVLGGDLNTGTQWPKNDRFNRRDRNVLDRIEALGLVDCVQRRHRGDFPAPHARVLVGGHRHRGARPGRGIGHAVQ